MPLLPSGTLDTLFPGAMLERTKHPAFDINFQRAILMLELKMTLLNGLLDLSRSNGLFLNNFKQLLCY